MRIKQISINNLFNIFNHVIPLKMESRITIIHGPNGFGKTILLSMVDALFGKKYLLFQRVPFSDFSIEFDNASSICIIKSPEDSTSESQLTVEFLDTRGKKYKGKLLEESLSRWMHVPPSMIDDLMPFLRRVGPSRWRDTRTGEIVHGEDVWERYSDYLPIPKPTKTPDWLKEVLSSCNVHFLGDQRLLRLSADRDESKKTNRAVSSYSKELAGIISTTLTKYAELSQSLDRSFPIRLVERGKPPIIQLEELRIKLNELESKRSRLVEAGLLDRQTTDVRIPQQLTDDAMSVLSVYVEDVEKKLSSLDELAMKLDLIMKIINKRFLYKQMSIDKEKGFVFSTPQGKPLAPTDLSSGEQHELVLLYELLFKVEQNSLFLIDEPELSLHSEWQREFLTDLQEVAKLGSFDVLIATHSSQIINDRWDLTVDLKGPPY